MFINITRITTALSALASTLTGPNGRLDAVDNPALTASFGNNSTLAGVHTFRSDVYLNNSITKRGVIAGGIDLRILPLGASITAGDFSSDYNGYRLPLANLLKGSQVHFAGTLSIGSMADNWNEGHSGYTIDQVHGSCALALSYRPNIILLHVGTNDLGYNADESWTDDRGASERLVNLIDFIFEKCPDAVLVVAQIIGTTRPNVQKRYDAYNGKFPTLLSSKYGGQKHYLVADMTSVKGSLLSSEGAHPNDAGYSKMASLWYGAIETADYKGWIKPPVSVPNIHPVDPSCISKRASPPLAGEKTGHFCREPPKWIKTNSNGGRIAHGVGQNGPAVFKPSWEKKTRAGPGYNQKGQWHVKMPDITGNGRADFVWIDEQKASLIVYGNSGEGADIKWLKINDLKPINKGTCALNRVKFAQLTTRAVDAWLNGGGDSSSDDGWKWTGPIRVSGPLPGGTRDTILFADMNGDGLDDMLVRGSKGQLDLWLNVWKANSANTYFQKIGRIATGTGTSNKTLADLNNDGRADIIIFNGDGAAYGFLNIRGQKEGYPVWKKQDSIAPGIGEDWKSIRMADVTGDGKADYVFVRDSDASLDVYVNNAPLADTSVVGDGTFFADLNGDGLDDKFFMDKNGQISIAHVNSGPNSKSAYGWLWMVQNDGNPISLGVGAKREQYRWGDVDGDGKMDMLVVDLDTGAVRCWLNKGANKDAKPRGWVWDFQGEIFIEKLEDGVGVFFADIDGDGFADLLWMSKTSQITIWINTRNKLAKPAWNWEKVDGTLNFNTGYRKDMRVADMNGDARADIIWVHPIDGSAIIFINNDYRQGQKGWSRGVPFPQNSAPGVGFGGANIHFARIHVNHGRADYIAVAPDSGAPYVWKNGCDHVVPSSDTSSGNNEDNTPNCGTSTGNPSTTDPNGGNDNGSDNDGDGDNGGDNGSSDSPGNGGENPQNPDASLIPFITVGDSTYTENSATQIIIGGQTLSPGGQITAGGTTISLNEAGNEAVVGTATQAVGLDEFPTSTRPNIVLTLGGASITANSNTQFIIGGQTLTPGGTITVSGTPIVRGSDGSTAVIGTSSESLLVLPPDAPTFGPTAGPTQPPASTTTGPVYPPCYVSSETCTVDGVTINEYTTIPSPTRHPGSRPTSGSAAFHALQPFAANGLRSLFAALSGFARLGNSPSSQDLASLTDTLATAFSDLSSLGADLNFLLAPGGGGVGSVTATLNAQEVLSTRLLASPFGDIPYGTPLSELGTLPGDIELVDLGETITETTPALARGVNGLATQIGGVIPKLQRCITDPASCKAIIGGIGGFATLLGGGTGLAVWVHGVQSTQNLAGQTPEGTPTQTASASATSSGSAEPTEWVVHSKEGTSVEAFEKFIDSLPDRGKGRRSIFPELKSQSYLALMTKAERAEARKNPIVAGIFPNGQALLDDISFLPPKFIDKRPRLDTNHTLADHPIVSRAINLAEQDNPPAHLKLISTSRNENFLSQPADAKYIREDTDGNGYFVYIIDSGIDPTHVEFNNVHLEATGIPGLANPANTDQTGHGTRVAAMIVGNTMGVAKRASVISVKFSDAAGARFYAFDQAWSSAVADIISKGRKGKATINFSGGFFYDVISLDDQDFDSSTFGYPVGDPMYLDPTLRLLKMAWDNDIVTVNSCSNDGVNLGEQSPRRFGRFNNPLITACRLTVRGEQSPGNGLERPASFGYDKGYYPLSGRKDIYAIGEGLRLPQSNSQTVFNEQGGQPKLPPNSYYDGVGGSSFVAPQIAALACYIGGSSLFQPLAAGTVALERKNQLVGLKRTETNLDALGAACNGIREQAPDSTPTPTPTSSAGPEATPETPRATCLSKVTDDNYLIRVFTNYIKDDGSALLKALNGECTNSDLNSWKVVYTPTNFEVDGTKWVSGVYYEFNLDFIPKEFVSYCVKQAVKDAGGPDLNNCIDSPLGKSG